jgi:hypothetical protein
VNDTPAEPRNWFFTLLVPASVVFVVTAVALAVVPVLEQRAIAAGTPPPPSVFRDALRRDGWVWLLAELGVVVTLALAAMAWDRWKQQPARSTTPHE